MEVYYKSIIGEIADGIDRLIGKGVLSEEKKILIYGLGRYSFAIRTILEHRGYLVAGYISDDEAEAIRTRRNIKDFACRYFNSDRDIIDVYTLEERLSEFDDDVFILSVEEKATELIERFAAFGYQENIHFSNVYDFYEEDMERMIRGKKTILMSEMKDIQKDMLHFIDNFCTENNLRYWVCGGTLLGTIRHEGFIPWDDDVDIFLPWPDYLKFLELFPNHEKYCISGMGAQNGDEFVEGFARVLDCSTILDQNLNTTRRMMAVFVDVFPLIGLPDNEIERLVYFRKCRELEKRTWGEFYAKDGNMKVLSNYVVSLKPFLERYDFDQAAYVGVLGTKYEERDCTSRKVYERTLRMKFEDIMVNVPEGYKEYLDNLYGKDWGELPDEEKRVSGHDMKAFWR